MRQGCRRSALPQSLGDAGSGVFRLPRKGTHMRRLLFFQEFTFYEFLDARDMTMICP